MWPFINDICIDLSTTRNTRWWYRLQSNCSLIESLNIYIKKIIEQKKKNKSTWSLWKAAKANVNVDTTAGSSARSWVACTPHPVLYATPVFSPSVSPACGVGRRIEIGWITFTSFVVVIFIPSNSRWNTLSSLFTRVRCAIYIDYYRCPYYKSTSYYLCHSISHYIYSYRERICVYIYIDTISHCYFNVIKWMAVLATCWC